MHGTNFTNDALLRPMKFHHVGGAVSEGVLTETRPHKEGRQAKCVVVAWTKGPFAGRATVFAQVKEQRGRQPVDGWGELEFG